MGRKIFNIIRTFPRSLIVVALIWYLCFFTPPTDTRFENILGFDKFVHFGMYFFLGLVVLWEGRKTIMPRLLVVALLPILMSGLIEILQEFCTNGRRSGDVWDFIANSLGALSIYFIYKYWLKDYFK